MKRNTKGSLLLALCLTAALLLQSLPAYAYSSPGELVSGADAYTWEMLRLTNKERMANGLLPLSTFGALQGAANQRASELVNDYHSDHTRPDGRSCFTVLPEFGLDYSSTGENIAKGYATPAAVVDAWMNSPGHRANILNGNYVHGGMGAISRSWEQLFLNDRCAITDMELIPGPNGWTLPESGSIDDLGAAVKLACRWHGDCYLPLTEEMCPGADTSQIGTVTVTARYDSLSAAFTLEITAPAPTQTEPTAPTTPSKPDTPVTTEPELYMVTYDANGGEVNLAFREMANGETYLLPEPTRTGYRFEGWYTARNGGTRIREGQTVDLTGPQTLYAHWSEKSFTVYFDMNGGSFTASEMMFTKQVTTGDTFGYLPTPVREGYRFDGWYYGDYAGGGLVTSSTIVDTDWDPILYAHWTESETPEFTDVPAGAYYHDAVMWARERGITDGMGNNTFGPDTTLTRAQAVTFLWRAAGRPAPAGSWNPFTDVRADAYYYEPVLWAVEQGITNGMGDGLFGVDGSVTRGQMITFLWRAEGKPNDTGGAWYEAAENWANANALLSGTASAYSTDAWCPRADVVYYMYRAE